MASSQSKLRTEAGDPSPRALPAFLQANTADLPAPSRRARKPVPVFATDLLIATALAAATFLLYLPALSANFIGFDDPQYVTSNPVVKRGLTLHSIPWAFTTNSDVNWLPIVWLSHLATVSAFGLDPGWHHAVNTSLHACNAALVFLVLRSMTGLRWPAALAAALWAFHPLRVESVAWISERKDVLSGLFFLLTLLAYSLYVRRAGPLRYGIVLALFAAALMSKPIVVTVPFLLLLLDVWPLKRGRWTLGMLAEKVPLLLMSAIASIGTFVLQRNGHAMKGQQWSLGQRVANADVSVARYLIKTVWPTGLSIFYPHPASWAAGVVVASAALIVGVTVGAWYLRRRMPYVLIGWLWFLGMLVPVCGLVQVGLQSMADRYTYLPSIGLSIALVRAGAQLARDTPIVKNVLVSLAVLVLAATTWKREAAWRTTFDLFQDALAVDEQNWNAHDFVGLELAQEGDRAAAMTHFQRAAELDSRNPYPLIHMGGMLLHEQTDQAPDQALALFRKGVELAPNLPMAHQWLGIGLSRKQEYADADREFAVAAGLKPDDPGIPTAWAISMAVRGRLDRARELAQTALDIDPTNATALDAVQWIDRAESQRHGAAPKAAPDIDRAKPAK